MIYRKNKRMKSTSDPPNLDSQITKVELESTSPSLPQKRASSLDQLVGSEYVPSKYSERMSKKQTMMLPKEGVVCSSSSCSQGPPRLVDDDNLLGDGISAKNASCFTVDELHGNAIENKGETALLVKENNDKFPKVTFDDSCGLGPPQQVDNDDPLGGGTSAKSASCDIQSHSNTHPDENSDKPPKASSSNALHLHQDQQVVSSRADLSLRWLGDINGISSEVMNSYVKVGVDNVLTTYVKKKLLVLDINGLLVDISSYVPYDYDPDEIILGKAVFKRPYCDDFLRFCFERFDVGVWTSKTKRNMEPIIDFLLGKDRRKLLFCWDQSHCTYTGYNTVEKRDKPLLLKKLKKLWDKHEPDLPWERGEYNEYNTVLLDDSPYKALCNPRYTGIFPYTYRFRDVRDNSIGPRGDLRAYLEGLAASKNVQEYLSQHPFGQRPITEKNLSWGFYCKVIDASSSPQHETISDVITPQ